MIIDLQREPSTPEGTFGRLAIAGVFLCFSLEPAEDRAEFPAIPAGSYKVIINESFKFHRRLPLIMNVPGRNGIRVHPGNFDDDTEGCILLGTGRNGSMLLNSRVACEIFQTKISIPLSKGQDVTLCIADAIAAPKGTSNVSH